MPVLLAERVAMLSGTVTVDEVEPLAQWVREHPTAPVVLHNCEHLHTAVLQLFLVHGTRISRPPRDPFLASWIMPLLTGDEESGPEECVAHEEESGRADQGEDDAQGADAGDAPAGEQPQAGAAPGSGEGHADSPDNQDAVEPADPVKVTVSGGDAAAVPISEEVTS